MKIDPILKIRYARGLGDILKCFLHSRYFNNITKLLTNKDHTCVECSIRANAMNIVFPIPMWKLFFKSEEKMQETFKQDLLDYGYNIVDEQQAIEQEKGVTKNSSCCEEKKYIFNNKNDHQKMECIHYDGYVLTQKTEESTNTTKIVTLVFGKM